MRSTCASVLAQKSALSPNAYTKSPQSITFNFFFNLNRQGKRFVSQDKFTEARRMASGPKRAPERPEVATSKVNPVITQSASVLQG